MPRICKEFWWGGPGRLWGLLLWGVLLRCFKDKTQHSSYIWKKNLPGFCCLCTGHQWTFKGYLVFYSSDSLLPAEANQAGLHFCRSDKSFVSCRPWLHGAVLTNLGRKKLKKWPDSFNQIRSVKVFKAPWKGNERPLEKPSPSQALC